MSEQGVGGNESHRIGSLTLLFQPMMQQVCEKITNNSEAPSKKTIMDKLRLAHKHLVFEWTSIDSKIKCSEIVAPINVEKVTPKVVAMGPSSCATPFQYMDWIASGKFWMPPEQIGLRTKR